MVLFNYIRYINILDANTVSAEVCIFHPTSDEPVEMQDSLGQAIDSVEHGGQSVESNKTGK